MNSQIYLQGIPISITPKPISTIYLRIDPSRKAVATIPLDLAQEKLYAFLLSHLDWMQQHVKKSLQKEIHPEKKNYKTGQKLFFLGKLYPLYLAHHPCRLHVTFQEDVIHLQVPHNFSTNTTRAFLCSLYRQTVKQEVEKILPYWTAEIGVSPDVIEYKDMTTRWSSCTLQTQRISFNIKLAQYPPVCTEYFLVDQLLFLAHPKDKARSEKLLNKLLPKWKEHRLLLNSPKKQHHVFF